MTRSLGVFVTMIAVPLFVAAQAVQDPAKEADVEQLGKDMVRSANAAADNVEARLKAMDAKEIDALNEQFKKIRGEQNALLTQRLEKLPREQIKELEKFKPDIDKANERIAAAKTKLEELPADDPRSLKKSEAKGDTIEDIIKRLKENTEVAVAKLNVDSKDPIKEAVQTQDKIMKDLKELLKQNSPNGGGGGGGGSSGDGGGNSGSSGGQGGSGGQSGGGSNQGGQGGGDSNKGGNAGGKDNNKGGNGGKDEQKNAGNKGQGQNGGQKDEPKDKGGAGAKDQPKGAGDKEQQAKGGGGGDPKKEDKGGGGGTGGNNNPKEKENRNADMYKDAWGHLPQHQRVEMENRTRGEFMRRYADMLDQYYRTIAEQGKKE